MIQLVEPRSSPPQKAKEGETRIAGVTPGPLFNLTNRKITMIGKYCMVRTYSAGVFAGVIKERNEKEVLLQNARRIWYWDGAATLSTLATHGTSKPENCKFPCPVEEVLLTEVIEIIPITDKAAKSINKVVIWKQ
jgi:hypothetical protein